MKDYFWPYSRAVMQPVSGNDLGGLPVGEHPPHRKASISEIALLDVRRTVLGGSVDAKQAEAILLDDRVVCGFLQKATGPTGRKGEHPPVSILKLLPRQKLQKKLHQLSSSNLPGSAAIHRRP